MMHIAIKAASLSTFRQRMGAAVIKGGRVYAAACNSIKYCKNKLTSPYPCSMHAERAAILMGDARGKDLYVARINNQGETMNAKPCIYCQELIKKEGIRNVYYTDEKGGITKWRVSA